jgi:protein-disulfide isomerase
MMKKILVAAGVVAIAGAGCQTQNKMTERLDAMEKRVETMEKKATATPPNQRGGQATAYNIPMGESPYMGKKDAKVSVVIFSDFQCPFCARTDPFLHDIMKDEELKNHVNVVFKQFPLSFHQNAKPAAKASMAAAEQGPEMFWKMAAKLYANQGALNPANYKKWAEEIGLNTTKFEADMKNNDAKYEAAIKKDMEIGTTQARVGGTPSIYVGGWELRERSVEGIKKLLKEKSMM